MTTSAGSPTSTSIMQPPLPALLTERFDAVAALCRQHDVRALYVFGSAAHGTFDPATSDLDFQVDLGEYEPMIARRYARLFNGLSELFGRDIDLLTTDVRGRQRFLDEVTATRRVVYVR